MTFSCRRATQLASNAMDRPLTRNERIAFRFHLLICAYCRRFRQQIQIIRSLLRRQSQGGSNSGELFMLNPDVRARIKDALQRSQ